MKCLYCDCTESKVIDSRSADDDKTIRRRRECVGCGRRFTTYETIEVTPVLVVKNNGTRQSYNAEKIRNGIIKACEKRPVPMAVIGRLLWLTLWVMLTLWSTGPAWPRRSKRWVQIPSVSRIWPVC